MEILPTNIKWDSTCSLFQRLEAAIDKRLQERQQVQNIQVVQRACIPKGSMPEP
jgi:hypothetical protein